MPLHDAGWEVLLVLKVKSSRSRDTKRELRRSDMQRSSNVASFLIRIATSTARKIDQIGLQLELYNSKLAAQSIFFLVKPNGHKKLHSVNQSSFLLRTEKRMLWHAGLFSLNCELCHWRRTTHEASSLVDSVISEEHFRPFSLLFSSSPSCPIF